MYEISIKHKDKGKVTYSVYTKTEADKADLAYKYWKEAEKGEYALTDDNYVGKVIQKKKYDSSNGVSSHGLSSFNRLIFRHNQNHLIAFHSCYHCQCNSSIS